MTKPSTKAPSRVASSARSPHSSHSSSLPRHAGEGKSREKSETEELRRFYTLNPEDLALIDEVRGDAHRLALALTLVWARAERVMITDPTVLPPPVIAFVSSQLSPTPAVLSRYRGSRSPTTRAADAATIREHLGLRTFGQGDAKRLRTFLHAKVANTGNSAALLDAAAEWLLHEGLFRPSGETTIERLMYTARAEAEEALFSRITGQLTPEQSMVGSCFLVAKGKAGAGVPRRPCRMFSHRQFRCRRPSGGPSGRSGASRCTHWACGHRRERRR